LTTRLVPAGTGFFVGFGATAGALVVVLGPGSPLQAVGIGLLAGAAGAFLGFGYGVRMESRAWLSAGRRLNLTPEGDAERLLDRPDLTGTVRGRRVRVGERTTQVGDDRVPYTHIETPLDPPAERGVVVYRNDDGGWGGEGAAFGAEPGAREPGEMSEMTSRLKASGAAVVRDEEFVVVGVSEELARAVVSGRSRRALLAADGLDQVWIGDPSGAFEGITSDLSDLSDGLMGKVVAEMFEGFMSGDPSTASNEGSRRLLYDGDALERHVEAVVAAVDAFEAARRDRR